MWLNHFQHISYHARHAPSLPPHMTLSGASPWWWSWWNHAVPLVTTPRAIAAIAATLGAPNQAPQSTHCEAAIPLCDPPAKSARSMTFSCNTCCWKCHWDIYIYILIHWDAAFGPGSSKRHHAQSAFSSSCWLSKLKQAEKRLERQRSNIDSLAAQFAPIETRMRLSSTVGLSSIPLRAGLHRWWTPVHPPQHWAHARYCPPPGHANICQYTTIK